ncbi:MAG: hypothetical protein BGO10_04435 [Chlamydia sp. 32-24]|nr:MAG: hypothetical protein BGO10_04435 [Chlamydia sp. 32-24]
MHFFKKTSLFVNLSRIIYVILCNNLIAKLCGKHNYDKIYKYFLKLKKVNDKFKMQLYTARKAKNTFSKEV